MAVRNLKRRSILEERWTEFLYLVFVATKRKGTMIGVLINYPLTPGLTRGATPVGVEIRSVGFWHQ